MNFRFNLKGLLLGALLFFTALVLHGPLSSADQDYELQQMSATFLYFCLFSFSVFKTGRALQEKLQLQVLGFAGPWLLGSIVFSFLAFIFTHLHLLTPSFQPVYFVILVILTALPTRPMRFKNEVLSFAGLPALITLGYFLQASILHFHTDPLMYHFLGPRDWVSQGGYYFPKLWSYVAQCSYWEYLLVWPNLIFGAKETYGIFDVHLFSQWTGVVFGFFPAVLILAQSMRHFLKSSQSASVIALLGAVSIHVVQAPIWIGKNDWFAVAMAITAFFFWIENQFDPSRKNRSYFGFFAGFAFMTKYTTIYLLLPLALFMISFEAVVFALLAASPIAVRNVLETGNPVIPLLADFFPTRWMSIGYKLYQKSFERASLGLQWDVNSLRLLHWWNYSPWFVFLPLGFFIRKNRKISFALALSAAWFLLYHPMGLEDDRVQSMRLMAPVIVAIGAFAVLFLIQAAKNKWLQYVLLTGFMIYGYKGFKELPKIFNMDLDYAQRAQLDQSAGALKAWLRLNPEITPDTLILSTGENQFFYVSYLKITSVMEQPELNEALLNVHLPDTLMIMLKRFSPDYILDTRHWSGRDWSGPSFLLGHIIKKYPEAAVAWTTEAKLIDFKKLREIYFPFCEDEKDDAYTLSSLRLSKPIAVW